MRYISVDVLEFPRYEITKAELVGGSRPRISLIDRETHQKYILKSYSHNSREVFAECLASFLGEILKISIQKVSIKKLPAQLASVLRKTCPGLPKDWVPIGTLVRNVFPKKWAIRYGASIIETPTEPMSLENIEQFLRRNYYAADDLLDNVATMIIFDALIGNMDRHHENWGILESEKYRQMILFNKKEHIKERKFTPLFDHGSSLLFELNEDSVQNYLNNLDGFREHYIFKSKYSFIKTPDNNEDNIFNIIKYHIDHKTDWGKRFKTIIKTKVLPISILEIAKKIAQIPDIEELNYSHARRELLLRSLIFRIENLRSIILE